MEYLTAFILENIFYTNLKKILKFNLDEHKIN